MSWIVQYNQCIDCYTIWLQDCGRISFLAWRILRRSNYLSMGRDRRSPCLWSSSITCWIKLSLDKLQFIDSASWFVWRINWCRRSRRLHMAMLSKVARRRLSDFCFRCNCNWVIWWMQWCSTYGLKVAINWVYSEYSDWIFARKQKQ